MTISPAKNSSATAPKEPLKRLLDAIEHARALPPADTFERSQADPLAAIRELIVAEAAEQSTTAPTEWGGEEKDTASQANAQGGTQKKPARSAPASSAASTGETGSLSADAGLEARVGREVLAVLRTQPLAAGARAAAVERLAAQLDNPDPQALRQVLAILVTGQHD